MDKLYVVGLGNPGPTYDNTPHNIGFMAIDKIANHFGAEQFSKKFDGQISNCVADKTNLVLFKPFTYMNNSGQPLLKLISFYKASCDDVIVLHDDIDLKFANIKIKQGGGHAGHNGLRSIDSSIGKNYWRLRIGIDRPEHPDISGYVLSKFDRDQDVDSLIDTTLKSFIEFLLG